MTIDFRADRIGSALRGENPLVLRKLAMSFAVMGDVQWLPGYCVLLVDRPGVSRLTDLDRPSRLAYLGSMELLAEAVQSACQEVLAGFRRMNLEILGNTVNYLHAHLWPRYDSEPPERLTKPVWLYPEEYWSDPQHRIGPAHDPLRDAIGRHIDRLQGS